VVSAARRGVIGIVCFAVLLSGCSMAAPNPVSSSSPPAVGAAPSGTVTMATLGWKNGPADRIVLPVGARIDERVDQANVITAIGGPAMADAVLTTLTDTLPSYGWTITASGGGSLVFSDAQYDGAFTSDSSLWALTIRVKA
jgi:hypothetical protein